MTAWNQLSAVNCESLEEYNAKFWDALLLVSSFKIVSLAEQIEKYCCGLPEGIKKYCTKTSVMNMAQLMENAEATDYLILGKPDKDGFKTRRGGHFANECPQRNLQTKDDKSDRKGKKPKPSAGLVPDLVGDEQNVDATELCRAWGKVRDQEVLVFYDSGACANFILPELASKLGIHAEEMGMTGEAGLACLGHLEAITPILGKLRLHIQSYVDAEEFHIMPLQDCDVLLGIPWLKSLEGWKIHNAFHVSLVRPFVDDVPEDMDPEEHRAVKELNENLALEHILAHKDRKVRGKVARRYLVKLKNYSPMDGKLMEEAELTQPELKSYPVEPIGPLACTFDGAYLVGGGVSGRIYLWEVSSGRLLRVWAAHYKAVSCLVFSDDESLLISGADDGYVNVWPLLRVLDSIEDGGAQGKLQIASLYAWSGHTLGVTGVFCGSGGSNAIVVSCSLDTSCKIWSLATGILLRTIKFPSAINTIVVDPGEYSLYAGSTDGKIFVAALNFGVPGGNGLVTDGMISFLISHSGPVTALAFSIDGLLLASASEDCTVCLWDTISCQTLVILKHSKGPLSNLLIVPRPATLQHGLVVDPQGCMTNRRPPVFMAAPLSKYVVADPNSLEANTCKGPVVTLPAESLVDEAAFDRFTHSLKAMERQIKEFEQQGSTAAMQLELERLRSDRRRALIMIQQWQQVHQDLYYFCVEELMGGSREREAQDDTDKEREREKGKKGRSKAAAKAR
ncbi:hypothetical protein L7F22_006171 [Adiantum nelumboides]|nr:hypothetical protein [Adiantum nelumboides]